jgi:hypothetical protein
MQIATEKDFLESVNKVIKGYAKFSSTPKYMTYVFYVFTVGIVHLIACNHRYN